MNKKIIWIWMILIFVLLICTGCDPIVEVKDGTRVECSKCGTLISDNTKIIKTVKSEIGKFQVQIIKSICSKCLAAEQEERRKQEEVEFSNPATVAKNFYEALKAKDTFKAQKYCESSIVDEQGMFGLWNLTYGSNYICSSVASRIDDNWMLCNQIIDVDDGKMFIFGDKRHNYILISTWPEEKKSNYLNGRKILAGGCIGFTMHKTNNKWMIYILAKCSDRYITER